MRRAVRLAASAASGGFLTATRRSFSAGPDLRPTQIGWSITPAVVPFWRMAIRSTGAPLSSCQDPFHGARTTMSAPASKTLAMRSGWSWPQVAEALGVSEQVVKVRLFRAKEKLRERLLERAGHAAADVFTFQAPRCDRIVAQVLGSLRMLIGN